MTSRRPGLLERLRSRAIHGRTRAIRAAALRSLLIHKARRRRWDNRMLNGHPGNVTPKVRSAIMRGVAAKLVVTSTTDGVHADRSYHNAKVWGEGRAVDLGLPGHLVGTAKGRARLVSFQRAEHRRGGQRELFGPDNRCNRKNGAALTLAEGSALEDLHDNHVHLAP